MNEKVEEMAMVADLAEADKVSEFSPTVAVNKDTMNRFIGALNKVLENFSAPQVSQVDNDVDGPLPPDVFKSISMINAALEDAKIDEFKIDLDNLESDRDFMMARGKLESAAKDRSFIAFLRKPMPDENAPVEVTEVEVQVEAPDAQEPDKEDVEDLDALLMNRMA